MKKVIGLMVLLLIAGCTPKPGLTEAQRREHLLMPQAGSDTHSEWTAKYDDTADSWQLFTLSFHTRYLQQLNARVGALERRMTDPNDPNDGTVN